LRFRIVADVVLLGHTVSIKALPDIRGLVYFATCECGWRGENHPSIPTVAQASERANKDGNGHRAIERAKIASALANATQNAT